MSSFEDDPGASGIYDQEQDTGVLDSNAAVEKIRRIVESGHTSSVLITGDVHLPETQRTADRLRELGATVFIMHSN